MPGAEQMAHLAAIFTGIDFWRLRPAPEVLARQPGLESPERHVAAARAALGDLLVVYVPQERAVALRHPYLPPGFEAKWFNPRTGATPAVVGVMGGDAVHFATPGEGDWVLVVRQNR
jgi:hypothetical protein